MRAGLLSSPEVIKKLKSDYICTWTLPEDVKEMAIDHERSDLKQLATTLILTFRPLVEMMVLSPEGVLVSHKSMNEDIMDNFANVFPPDEAALEFFLDYLEDSDVKATGNEVSEKT